MTRKRLPDLGELRRFFRGLRHDPVLAVISERLNRQEGPSINDELAEIVWSRK